MAETKRLVTVIRPSKAWFDFRFKELWERRELLYFFAWRDVKSRYKQSVLGIAWVIVQPLVTMVVFSFVFGRLAKLPSDGIPYPLFAYAAVLPWNLFAQSLTRSTPSIVSNVGLVQRVFFPRLLIPLSSSLTVLVDFAIAFLVVIGLMLYFGYHPSPRILTLPVFVLLGMAAALGIGLWLSAINARFRDVNQAVPFLVQVWMYASPVAYSANSVPENLRFVYSLNPMVGVIHGFRWALLGSENEPSMTLLISTLGAIMLLLTGLMFFRRMENTFADVA